MNASLLRGQQHHHYYTYIPTYSICLASTYNCSHSPSQNQRRQQGTDGLSQPSLARRRACRCRHHAAHVSRRQRHAGVTRALAPHDRPYLLRNYILALATYHYSRIPKQNPKNMRPFFDSQSQVRCNSISQQKSSIGQNWDKLVLGRKKKYLNHVINEVEVKTVL